MGAVDQIKDLDSTSEEVWITYCGERLAVIKEVAEFLAKNRKECKNANRVYREHNVPLIYTDPDEALDTEHCTGRNYLLNVVIRNERAETVRNALAQLPDDLQRLYHLRYEEDLTQQMIADMEGISKMAICKRQKKLHEQVREALPDWPKEDFMV